MIFLFSSIFKRIIFTIFLSLSVSVGQTYYLFAETKTGKQINKDDATNKQTSISNNEKNKNLKNKVINSSGKNAKIVDNDAKVIKYNDVEKHGNNIVKQAIVHKKDPLIELIDSIESGKIKVSTPLENTRSCTSCCDENSVITEHYAGMVGDKTQSTGMNLDLFLEAKNKNDFILVISGKNVNDGQRVKTALSNKRFAMDILFDKGNGVGAGKSVDLFTVNDDMVNFTYQIPKNVRLKYGHQTHGYTIALYFENDVTIVDKKNNKDEIVIRFTSVQDQNPITKNSLYNSYKGDKIFINHEKPIIIAIDAGHGGADSGAIANNNIQEKNITLKYAKRLKDALMKYGFKVIMIRNDDKTIPLFKRVKIAKDANADVYISLHTDAHKNKKISGTTVYSLSKLDMEHPDWRRFHNKTYLPSSYINYINNFNVLDILIDMTHKSLLEKSQVLSDNILSRFKTENICKRCRHGQRSLAVLRGLDMISILIEIGYITNDDELKKIQNNDYIDSFISNLAFVIKNTFTNKL